MYILQQIKFFFWLCRFLQQAQEYKWQCLENLFLKTDWRPVAAMGAIECTLIFVCQNRLLWCFNAEESYPNQINIFTKISFSQLLPRKLRAGMDFENILDFLFWPELYFKRILMMSFGDAGKLWDHIQGKKEILQNVKLMSLMLEVTSEIHNYP